MDTQGYGTANHLSETLQQQTYCCLQSGSTPGKIFHFLGCLRVACTTDRTFHLHQSQYLQPAVISVWNHHQRQILSAITKKDCPLTVGGDGRADSPSHSAKYGSYGVIDLDTNKVLHIELVQVYSEFSSIHFNVSIKFLNYLQSNEVKSSNHMEKFGLVKALQFLADNSLQVTTLVTDRHKQIAKYMAEEKPDIEHRYDAWHISIYIYTCIIIINIIG